MQKISSHKILRGVVATLVSIYFIYYACTPNDWHAIDNVNLIIHEAGHFVCIFFGSFLHILGGLLLQVLLPIAFVVYFYRTAEYFSAALLLFWVGQNLINVSVYASDAIVMQLPLLGGDSVLHDWNTILSMTGVLEYTKIIGTSIYMLGLIVIGAAAYFSFITSQRTAERV